MAFFKGHIVPLTPVNSAIECILPGVQIIVYADLASILDRLGLKCNIPSK